MNDFHFYTIFFSVYFCFIYYSVKEEDEVTSFQALLYGK